MIIGNLKLFEKVIIGPVNDPLLIRYVLWRLPVIGMYLHNMRRSDYDRANHNHPWSWVSLVLKGGYWEWHDQTLDGKNVKEWRGPGSVLVRPAQWRHRFELPITATLTPQPSWTLVIVGRRCQKWGFFLPDGWCWWRKHNYKLGICEEEVLHTGGKD